MSEATAGGLGGQWFLAALMIVLVGWFLFRYMAPKSWKEWRAFNVVQAFVVALYTEMYGFPLTIYVLTSVFGIDTPLVHFSGHLWSSLLGLGPIGAMLGMILGYGVIAVGLTLLAGGWRQIYRDREEDRPVTDGLYRYVRHPQYTGIFLGIIGQAIHWPTILTLVFAPFVLWLYYRLARREEAAMVDRYGDEYRAYMKCTSRFWPGMKNWRALLRARPA